MTELHQVNRRIFIRDFGRGVLGISIGSFLLTACADDAVVASSTMPAPGTQATSAAAITTTAAVAPPTTIQTGSTELAIERVNMGFVSAYLMVRGADVALVDTGSGGSEDQIEQALSEVGLAWGSVGTVILTHNYPDHAGSLSAVLSQVSDAVVGTGADDIGGSVAWKGWWHSPTVRRCSVQRSSLRLDTLQATSQYGMKSLECSSQAMRSPGREAWSKTPTASAGLLRRLPRTWHLRSNPTASWLPSNPTQSSSVMGNQKAATLHEL